MTTTWSVPEPGREPSETRAAPIPAPAPHPPVPTQLSVRRAHAHVQDPLGGSAAPGHIEAALRRRQGSGRPLSDSVAADMASGFGVDFSAVRVHTDPEAASISRSLQASAFSYGSDLYFAGGRYQPHAAAGRQLLAHELAHVVQGGAGSAPGVMVGRADDPAEHQADLMAATALRRRLAPPLEPVVTPNCAEHMVRRRVVPDNFILVRGGMAWNVPAADPVVCAAFGSSLADAGHGVPHGNMWQSSAANVRAVDPTITIDHDSEGGNTQHVTLRRADGTQPFTVTPNAFAGPVVNPAAKNDRYKNPGWNVWVQGAEAANGFTT